MKKTVKNAILERIIALFFGLLLVGGILYQNETLTSGYHFMDDHELLRIEYSIDHEGAPVLELAGQSILNDFHWRYRPLYWAERVIGTAIMGSNMFCWNIYKAVMGIITFYLLYLAARYLKNRWYTSTLFAGIIMIGPQFTPWYRSANQENTGLFLCAAVLYLIARQYHTKKWKSYWYNSGIAVSIILCGLVKESFTLMMPLFLALKFWLEYCSFPNGRLKSLWKDLLKKELLFYLLVLGSFLTNIYMILFHVGVDQVSYAGFHDGTSLSQYVQSMLHSLTTYVKWPFWFGLFILVLVVMCWQLIDRRQWKIYVGFSIIGFGIMGLQLVAHATSGMWERYIIPFIIGYAIVFVLLGSRIFAEDKLRRRVYAGVLTVLLLLGARQADQMAKNYAQDGQLIDGYMNYVLDNTAKDSTIIGAFTAGELNVATSCWLEFKERPLEFSYDWSSGQFKDEVQMTAATGDVSISWQDADVVLCYSNDVSTAINMMGLSGTASYERIQYGAYAVIVREKAGNQ